MSLQEVTDQGASADVAVKGKRPVFYSEVGDFTDTPIYDRNLLAAGMTFPGPAVVEEKDSTAVIGPNATVLVDANSNLIVTLHRD
ncbi:MAG: hypothetical protein R2873_35375 [Caldilineaceae bacterium]